MVSDHNLKFVETLNEPLKPVHYFLEHYARFMRRNGQWHTPSSKRSESKHREGKVASHVTNSRIMLPLTLAIKQQLKLSYRLLSKCALIKHFHAQGEGLTMLARHLLQYHLFADLLNVPGDQVIKSYQHVEFKHTYYRVGSVLVVDANDLLPIFSLLRNIVNDAGHIVYMSELYSTTGFNEHFHTFCVEPSDIWYGIWIA